MSCMIPGSPTSIFKFMSDLADDFVTHFVIAAPPCRDKKRICNDPVGQPLWEGHLVQPLSIFIVFGPWKSPGSRVLHRIASKDVLPFLR